MSGRKYIKMFLGMPLNFEIKISLLLHTLFLFYKLKASLGEGSGTPLQCSCLENTMDRGAW